jgi:hypothetical protein
MKLEESIIEQLPQIPYVIDQVGEAMAWAKEDLDEGEYNKILQVAYEVAEFTKTVSNPNFFKTHYVIATILSAIENAKSNERFSKFDSASKAVEKSLDAIVIDPKSIEEKGCFKSVMLHLIPLAKEDMELFTISLIGMKNTLNFVLEGIKQANVKSPITAGDYITILGYALVMANIRMANLKMTNEAYKVYNEISVMLNNDLNY